MELSIKRVCFTSQICFIDSYPLNSSGYLAMSQRDSLSPW